MDKSPAAVFKPAVTYFGYTINFLSKPVMVKLKDQVTLKICKFGLLVKDLSDDDISTIDESVNTALQYSMSIDPESFFIKKYSKWNTFNSKGQRIQTLPDEFRAHIQLKITGYKISPTGKPSPMMEIQEIRQAQTDFV